MGGIIMTLDLSHLSTAAKQQAFQDSATRIHLVQSARWVGFARAQLALEELERRFTYPTCARMPCMLLYGESGMGKTMILEKMERAHPNSHHERRGITIRPVLTVQMPPSPDERRFYTRLLEILGAPYTSHDQLSALEARALFILKDIGTKLLCIDEVHHLLAGSQREQRRALNLLKFLANDLRIAGVVIGTNDAFHALQSDPQVASRFEPLLLPRWTEADAFRAFVMAYGRLLPLRKPSAFGEPAMIRTLLNLSGGITGRVTALLSRAAESAIGDSSERVDVTTLERVSERLRVAAA
jgi:hypothetical protein